MIPRHYVLIVRAVEPGQQSHGFTFSAANDTRAVSERPHVINARAPDGSYHEFDILSKAHEVWKIESAERWTLLYEQDNK